jgi:DedD protein
MAFFKFRKGGDELAAPGHAPESVEAMRKRARHRLIGSAVLVSMGVIGFPLLFDNQPRPVALDIPIDIPDRAKVAPLAIPATPPKVAVASAPVAPPVVASASAPAPVVSAVPVLGKVAAKPDAKPAEIKPADKPAQKMVAKPVAKTDEGAKAQALLEGKDAPPPATAASAAAGARFVVQVGAYSDAAKARDARLKLEKAGLKTYTQVVNPPEGKRIRVRVGPFESKAEADKIADKIKKLELSAQILEL